jgi:hypothetical protein
MTFVTIDFFLGWCYTTTIEMGAVEIGAEKTTARRPGRTQSRHGAIPPNSEETGFRGASHPPPKGQPVVAVAA